ncbi:MAG: nucleotidyl transferase AbiEii/AbiGii toxin family protein [Planctomycetota bacterium]|nr:nucleotidyl transferase AbiEii/AbiGii toxin family protein [Planctomycetota bacterium]
MKNPPHNIAASVRQRLLNLSKASGVDYNQLLIRYAIERLLYRLSRSVHRDNFVLKGAMLFVIWEGSPHRPTQDVDLLGFGDRSPDRIASVFRELCETAVEDDGIIFAAKTVEAEEIRTTDEYGGVRVRFTASLGGAVIRVQADIGFGDAITPASPESNYPTLLPNQPAPHLRVYPRETVVAEKLEAIAKLGMLNTQFKDYYDLRYLAERFEFDGPVLIEAIAATFERRGTPLPPALPAGLGVAFATDPVKQTQWAAFRRRQPEQTLRDLPDVIAEIKNFIEPPLLATTRRQPFLDKWNISRGWTAVS